MYFFRRSWGRGSTKHPVPSLPLLHLHGDVGEVVLPAAVDHKLGQHLTQQQQLVKEEVGIYRKHKLRHSTILSVRQGVSTLEMTLECS